MSIMSKLSQEITKLEETAKGFQDIYKSELESEIQKLTKDLNIFIKPLHSFDGDQFRNQFFSITYRFSQLDASDIGTIFPFRKIAFIDNSKSLGKSPLLYKYLFNRITKILNNKGYSVEYSSESPYTLVQYLTKIDPN